MIASRQPTESRSRPTPKPRTTIEAKAKDVGPKAKDLDFGLKEQGLISLPYIHLCNMQTPC